MASEVPPVPADQPEPTLGSAASDGLANVGTDRSLPGGIDFDIIIGLPEEDAAVPVSYAFANADDASARTRRIEERAVAAVVRTALEGTQDPSLASRPARRPTEDRSTTGKVAHADYYDQDTSPIPRRRYLDLARQSAFPSSKVGKQVLARRVDVDTFIADRAVRGRRPPSGDPPDLPPEEIDDVLARAGLRRKP